MISRQKIAEMVSAKAKSGSKLLLQLPEGLKIHAVEIAYELEKVGYSVILSNDPCYGACDIREKEAHMVNASLIVHVGHKRFYKEIKSSIPVLFIPLELEAAYDKKQLAKIKEHRIGVVSTVNYSHLMEGVAKDLMALGKSPVIGGEILGCNVESAKNIDNRVDCFLFVGTGKFHPSGLKTHRPVYFLDLEKNQVEIFDIKDAEREHRIKYAKIEKFRASENIGILLSSKHGQFFHEFEHLKKRIERTGKKTHVLILDCITNERLMGLKIDFFINTACPRLAEDHFDKPVMNVADFLEFYG